MIMKISLFISFLLHLALILTFQKAFPLEWAGEVLRTYRVEMIRPPVEDLDVEAFSAAEVDQLRHEKQQKAEEDQDTISLDTDDERYVSYARAVKERIFHQWRYPPRARESLIEGKLMVVFTLKRNGQMVQVKVLDQSEFEILDNEAVRAITEAAPFPFFPDHITVNRLNIKASFDYRLTSRR
jgi:TonB family protein